MRTTFGEKCYICCIIIILNSINYERIKCISSFSGWCSRRCSLGILFAPEKGEDTRNKIAEILRKKGIKLNRNEMENLVDEIAAEIKGEIGE